MKSELFTAEMLKQFFFVVGSICVIHAGAIVGFLIQHFIQFRKMRFDLRVAFARIRALEKQEQKPEEVSNGIGSDPLQKQVS